jgi:hypothetical protein
MRSSSPLVTPRGQSPAGVASGGSSVGGGTNGGSEAPGGSTTPSCATKCTGVFTTPSRRHTRNVLAPPSPVMATVGTGVFTTPSKSHGGGTGVGAGAGAGAGSGGVSPTAPAPLHGLSLPGFFMTPSKKGHSGGVSVEKTSAPAFAQVSTGVFTPIKGTNSCVVQMSPATPSSWQPLTASAPPGPHTQRQPMPMPSFPVPCSPDPSSSSRAKRPSNARVAVRSFEQDVSDAVEQGSVSLLKLALTCKYRCHAAQCLHELVTGRNLRALDFLLRCGTENVDEHCRGLRPLHLALKLCAVEGDEGFRMLDRLLRHGARPERLVGDGFGGLQWEAPLHDAARRCLPTAVELLLAHGAEPNCSDVSGNSPLHVVCRVLTSWNSAQALRVVSTLLQAGGCPLRANAAGKLPSEYAQDAGVASKLRKVENWYSRRWLMTAHRSILAVGEGSRGTAASGGRCVAEGGERNADSDSRFVGLPPEVFDQLAAFL